MEQLRRELINIIEKLDDHQVRLVLSFVKALFS